MIHSVMAGQNLQAVLDAALPGDEIILESGATWLGSYLTRLNRRLRDHGLVVQPGDLKRTYRLNVV